MTKLITSNKVSNALDSAITALTAMRETYTCERDDIAGTNLAGPQALLNAAHDGALITRQLQFALLSAASDEIGQPVGSYDLPAVLEMEGADMDIYDELKEMFDDRLHEIQCRETAFGSGWRPNKISMKSETSPTDHLRVNNKGRLV